jgi:hypothetical protein
VIDIYKKQELQETKVVSFIVYLIKCQQRHGISVMAGGLENLPLPVPWKVRLRMLAVGLPSIQSWGLAPPQADKSDLCDNTIRGYR